ncbi:MAG: T9SS type A sorting domain-containing protein, partial [Proteobacteria bacterium]|nr:T9SS type A sorting domain-containing protein [Pseudomonadota bacterium]
VLAANKPRIVVINFPDVDVAGHAGNFSLYLSAIRRADSLTAELWDVLESDPNYAGTTTMFVTNDHGRHDDANGGFQNHGDSCEGCRHIILLAVGRSIPPDRVADARRSQIDIAPTVGGLLAFSTPLAQGMNLLADTVTAVPTNDGDQAPVTFRLFQNYPNPFNGTTRIVYELPAAGKVRVALHDLLGREVRVLADEFSSPGTHRVILDAGDLPTGLYLIRLAQAGYFATTKILLLK